MIEMGTTTQSVECPSVVSRCAGCILGNGKSWQLHIQITWTIIAWLKKVTIRTLQRKQSCYKVKRLNLPYLALPNPTQGTDLQRASAISVTHAILNCKGLCREHCISCPRALFSTGFAVERKVAVRFGGIRIAYCGVE